MHAEPECRAQHPVLRCRGVSIWHGPCGAAIGDPCIRELNMSVHDLNAHKQFRKASVESCTRVLATQIDGGTSYRIFRDGVLHSVAKGIEPFVRNTVLALSNRYPEHTWDYVQALKPDGATKCSCAPFSSRTSHFGDSASSSSRPWGSERSLMPVRAPSRVVRHLPVTR